MIDLSIIIVNYNVKEFLLNLLESIQKSSVSIKSEIIVIDNNSDDGSVETLEAKYPNVKLIANKENRGFGAANNQGLEISKGKHILLINPDTLVKENTFNVMLDFLKDNTDVGLAGCKVLNPDGTLQLACRRSFPKPWVSFTKVVGLGKLFPKSKLFAKYNLTYLDENESNEVDAISGSFMMFPRKVYKKVGGFDTDFFMYGEDLDLCYRIQNNGFKVFYVSDTEIIHYKGESTKRSKIDETKVFYNAMHLFVKKHFSSSFIVETILQFAIILRKLFAFANINKYIILGLFIDFISFVLLINLAENIYSSLKWPGFPDFAKPWVYIIPAILQLFISIAFGSYKRKSLSVLRMMFSLIAGLILLTSLTFFFKQFAFSRAVVLLTYGFSFIVFSIWRIILKFTFLNDGVKRETQSNTLLVGTDEKTILLAEKLKNNLSSNYKIVGLVSNSIKDLNKIIGDNKVIGSLENLQKVISLHKINNVIFSAENIEFDSIFSTVAECQGENVDFMISGNELDYMVGKSNITHIEDVPLLKVQYNISSISHRVIKRSFDIVLSIILLITMFPIIFVLSKIAKLKNAFSYTILKLPKVLFGDYSFVGPVNNSKNKELFLGKLGLTGLWFIENNENLNEVEINRLDLFYAKNQNIWLDLEIIGKTIAKYLISWRNND